MKDISILVQQLKNRKIQIDQKISHIIDQNPDPFPFERLAKGKKLTELIQKAMLSIDRDHLILAGMYIKELEIEGLKLDL